MVSDIVDVNAESAFDEATISLSYDETKTKNEKNLAVYRYERETA